MLPLQLNDNQTIMAIGLSVVAVVFILRRTLLRTSPFNRRPSAAPSPAEIEDGENTATALVEQLEVRLYDFAREVEGRMQTKIAVLDRLIVDADREIIRLERVLAEARRLDIATTNSRQPDAIVAPSAVDGSDPPRRAA
jgi:hypothetical protein